ncbi:hypothetical protein [Porphyromonas circumdentaria]|uniref:Uncharacterized protein n=1 Tax=Porphyromonas circumdentaria TaxID=29524 RepID=A0A1T4L9Y9_9PORP|nr:hypothetical protein [Porphyromonas circumdentaria]MBB6275347.1 hypothetical protein [Porphyromonas circumdentaria]SJZ51388.1 hypothetical protein SAMN02745171_00330 [Porphyromonas circumdentaria]
MNTDRMDTSAVYALFEELKQSLTEIASFLKGRSEQQTIDLSRIEELFERMNTLSKQEVFSPEQIRVLEEILTKSVVAGLETVFEKLDGWNSEKRETLQAIEAKIDEIGKESRTVIRKEHILSLDFKNSKTVITLCSMGLVLLFSLVGNFRQMRQNGQLSDNDLKYRYIKMYGEVNQEKLMNLETLFTYQRDEQQIALIREEVETYERLVKEQAEKTEQARLNTSQANELHKQAESIKQRK